MTERPLWTPDDARMAASNLKRFMERVERVHDLKLETYKDVLDFSVTKPHAFWSTLWDFCDVRASERGSRVLIDSDRMPGGRFFPDARLNYAENLLRKSDDSDALVFRGEDKVQKRMSWKELNAQVARMHRALAAAGVVAGDRVCAVVPNMPETIVCFPPPPRSAPSGPPARPTSASAASSTASARSRPRSSSPATATTMPARPSAWPRRSAMC